MESTEINAKVAVAEVSRTSFFSSANPATKSKHWAGVSTDPGNKEQKNQGAPEQSTE